MNQQEAVLACTGFGLVTGLFTSYFLLLFLFHLHTSHSLAAGYRGPGVVAPLLQTSL